MVLKSPAIWGSSKAFFRAPKYLNWFASQSHYEADERCHPLSVIHCIHCVVLLIQPIEWTIDDDRVSFQKLSGWKWKGWTSERDSFAGNRPTFCLDASTKNNPLDCSHFQYHQLDWCLNWWKLKYSGYLSIRTFLGSNDFIEPPEPLWKAATKQIKCRRQ